jgi:type I restriction enzyme, S subunit
MNNWRRVDDIIEYFGKGVTPKYVDESSIIVLNQKCIRNNKIDFSLAQYIDDNKDYVEIKFLKIGDILVNSTGQGTAGRVAFLDFIPEGKRIIVDSHILVLRTKDFYESRCLNYSLFSIEHVLQSYLDGSTGQGEFDRVRLFNIQVNYSEDKTTQQKIAEVLSDLDAKIELNNRINAELEAMAKLLYEYWFVQFDFPISPEQAEKMGNPTLVGKPYKSSGGKMVWNKELKREIPEEWRSGTADEIFEFNPSLSIPKGGVAKYLDMNSIPQKGFMTLEPEVKEFNGGVKFQNGDVVVARITPCLENGKTGLISQLEGNKVGFGSTEFIVIRGKKMELSGFVSFLARSDSFRNFAIGNMTGTSGRKRVDAKTLKNYVLPIPDSETLKEFEAFTSLIFQKQTINVKQSQQLSALRDWLLPMLMNGQVTVAEAVERVEEELGMVAEREREEYGAK